MEYQEIFNQIKESPILLIGIGNELLVKGEHLEKDMASLSYAKEVARLQHQENRESLREYVQAYEVIRKLTEGKDYFIVTTNTDGMLEQMGFDPERIVTPCGSIYRMQCEDMSHGVWDIEQDLLKDGEFCCPVCHKPGKLNHIKNKPYNEAGYQQQWAVYTRWLQRTINRKIFLLELGEGFETPTVIRWPFEKIAFINQKSAFARVNATLPQLTEEMQERAFSIKNDSMSFLRQISELLNE